MTNNLISIRKMSAILFLILLGLLFIGCDKSSLSETNSADNEQKNQESQTASSPAIITTQSIGSAGGDVEVKNPESPILGAKVRVPKNIVASEAEISLEAISERPEMLGCAARTGIYISSNNLIRTSDNPMTIYIPFKQTAQEAVNDNLLRLVFAYNLSSKQWVDVNEPIWPLPSPDPQIFVGVIYNLENNIAYFPVVCDLTKMAP